MRGKIWSSFNFFSFNSCNSCTTHIRTSCFQVSSFWLPTVCWYVTLCAAAAVWSGKPQCCAFPRKPSCSPLQHRGCPAPTAGSTSTAYQKRCCQHKRAQRGAYFHQHAPKNSRPCVPTHSPLPIPAATAVRATASKSGPEVVLPSFSNSSCNSPLLPPIPNYTASQALQKPTFFNLDPWPDSLVSGAGVFWKTHWETVVGKRNPTSIRAPGTCRPVVARCSIHWHRYLCSYFQNPCMSCHSMETEGSHGSYLFT